MFAAMGDESCSFKADPDERAALLAQGEPWFVPAYVGTKGWLGVRLVPEVDPEELAELLTTSWRLIAPKRLAARFDVAGGPPATASTAAPAPPRPCGLRGSG